MIFKYAIIDLELFVVQSTYFNNYNNAFQQLQGGLYNEFDNTSFELKVLEVHFSVVTQFLIVHVTSNPQEL